HLPGIGRPHRRLRRRSVADDGARRRAMDHGVRSLSDGDAGVQTRLRRRSGGARVPDFLRTRSPHRRRVPPAQGHAAVRGAGPLAGTARRRRETNRMSDAITIGIIGGSGLYDMAELTDREERRVTTPFGDPSDPYVVGTLRGKRVAFLARHGVAHRYSPSELNYRANIFGLKMLGVDYVLSASAVGSLQERYVPQQLVIPDQ